MKFTLPDSVADPAEQVLADGLGYAIASLTRADDPLRKLLDPEFLDVLWEYEHSRTEPLIPGSLHAKQAEFLEDDSKHRWLFGGNQSGKTTVGAVDLALTALGRHPEQRWDPPVTLWASALTWELWEQILLPELLTWLPPDRIIDAPAPSAKSTKRIIRIRADNGSESRIVGKSAEQGAQLYQSARVHKVWFDEEHPLSIWREVLPRLLRFGGTTLGTMTPLMGLTWIYWNIYEPWKRGQTVDHFCLHVGLADNPGVDPENIEALKRELAGNPAELEARLHGYFMRPTGLGLNFDPNKNFDQDWKDDALIDVMRKQNWEQFCGMDFGYWRWAFVHNAADRAKRVHVIAERFSQKESLETRAKWMHEHLTKYQAPRGIKIAGDSANPQDITEINKELKRLDSPYRVSPVAKVGSEGRSPRQAAVTRWNNLLERGAFLIRRNIGEYQSWRLGQSAASDGTPMIGSRLLYEINAWAYKAPKDEKAQDQSPDDNTADGADMIAAQRYALMTWWKAAKFEPVPEKKDRHTDYGLERIFERHAKQQRQLRRYPF